MVGDFGPIYSRHRSLRMGELVLVFSLYVILIVRHFHEQKLIPTLFQ